MSLVTLKTELRQELKLTPQLLQSMEVLQMNAQELLEYIGRISEENPLIEQEDAPALHAAYADLRRQASWIDSGPQASGGRQSGELPEQGYADRETESLTAFLIDQLDRLRLPKPLLAVTRYLAELVDEDGRLGQEDLDALSELQLPQALIDQALATLQGLEPAGVAARDLAECLSLQLRRQGAEGWVVEIAERFLPELGRKRYGPICRAMALTPEQVQAAEACIAGLDPRPGSAFQAAEPAAYVRPDVFIVELDGVLQVVLNEYYLPRVSISDYYARLLKESDEQETRTYLRQKMEQAKWLLHSLDRRGMTLRLCAQAVLDAQRPFFEGKNEELAPMKLTSLAQQLGVHPSTVSRAIRGKSLQCRQGTYPMRYFFSRELGHAGPSAQAVRHKLLELVRAEDPRHPLSDQKLAALLEQQGIHVARRTVAKYRDQLGLGSAAHRRR